MPFRPTCGFTLLEVLAVACILALVAGLGVTAMRPVLRSTVGLAPARAALARQIAELRLLARENGGVTVRCERRGLRPLRKGLAAAGLPADTGLVWRRADGSRCERWRLDARGRGPDLHVVFTRDGEREEWVLAGLTGLLVVPPESDR